MADSLIQERMDPLRSVPMFSGLRDVSLKHVLDIASEFEVEAGHVLIRPDQPGAVLFVVEEGTVVVERRGGNIDLAEGEFLGELALLSEDAVHPVRVRAATPVRFLAIPATRALREQLCG